MRRCSWFVLGTIFVLGSAGHARADIFDQWRDLTIDFCQRLPTVAEVDHLIAWNTATANDPARNARLPNAGEPNAPSYNFRAVIEACSRADGFASVVGLMSDDFTLPRPNVPQFRFRTIDAGTFQDVNGQIGPAGQTHYYWKIEDAGNYWSDCLDPANAVGWYQAVSLTQDIGTVLEKAYDPWWLGAAGVASDDYETDAQGNYVWVCRWTSNVGGAP